MRWTTTLVMLGLGCSEPALPRLDGGRNEVPDPDAGAADAGPDMSLGGGVGEGCSESSDCRPGLNCRGGECDPAGDLEEGDTCVAAAECGDGLQCAARQCTPLADDAGDEGAACESDLDCVRGLRCAFAGFSLGCLPEGDGDLGAACGTSVECLAGLGCFASRCSPPPPGVPPFVAGPFGTDIECAEPTEGHTRAYFEVPGVDGGDPGDFFRLPFPNDAAIVDGRPDYSGFPTPGETLLGFDPVQRYIDAVRGDFHGWSPNASVVFRFSAPVDFETLRTVEGEPPRVLLIDLDPESPRYGEDIGPGWFYSGGGWQYVCRDWIGVRASPGALSPGGVYGIAITRHARDKEGRALERAPHFEQLLSVAAPADTRLAEVWRSYAPLRDWLEQDEGFGPDDLLVASVITIAEPDTTVARLAETIAGLDVPVASAWTRCAAGVESPCPQRDGDRGCPAEDERFEEYHALLELPVFQQGAAPYLLPQDGGGVDPASPARSESVCVSLTVPRGDAPEAGWPLAVFAHGSGGSFRTHVSDAVAGELSDASVPGGSVPMAVLGFDQVQHGTRRGGSDRDPKDLFFNYANPDAARGNAQQGAADLLSVARFAATLDVTAGETGGRSIRVDPEAIVFFGQSQGSTHGSLGAPFSTLFKASVLSGNGGSLAWSLLTKRSPIDIAAGVAAILPDFADEPDNGRKIHHPVLTLMQQWIDPADPLNFARRMTREPAEGVPPKHLFQPVGLRDTYSPVETMQQYARAGRLDEVAPDQAEGGPAPLARTDPLPAPAAGNLRVDGSDYTHALRQYAPPEGVDGHFVSFEVRRAVTDIARFLGMAARGEVPQIGL